MQSPYKGRDVGEWDQVTAELIANHPLDTVELVEVALQVWADVFASGIGAKPFKFGVDLFPRPQVMAYFLHELIPLELARRYPLLWRREETTNEKDLVYVPDQHYSVEIKTSSSANKIFGNRSYAQEADAGTKLKSGYYLTINFEGFQEVKIVRTVRMVSLRSEPKITLIRFGWLDHADWAGQKAATGQQSSLDSSAYLHKLVTIFPA